MPGDKLQRKLIEQQQKNLLKSLYSELPGPLAEALQACPVKPGDDLWVHIDSWPIEDASTVELDDLDTVLEVVTAITVPAGNYALFLAREAPPITIEADLWHTHSTALLNLTRLRNEAVMALVSADATRGFMLSEHVGYLPDSQRTNNNEIIYTLKQWGWTAGS